MKLQVMNFDVDDLSTCKPGSEVGKIKQQSERFNRALIPREVVVRLNQTSALKALGYCVLQWGLIVLSIVMSVTVGHWAMYVAAVLVIGSRQHALLILMHESVHHHLFKNKKLSDWFSDLLLALPFGILTSSFRRFHFSHHRYVNQSNDPEKEYYDLEGEYQFPKSPYNFAKWVIADLTGISFISTLRLLFTFNFILRLFDKDRITAAELIRVIIFYSLAIGFISYFQCWKGFFAYWVVPGLTVMAVSIRLRAIAEHMVTPNDSELHCFRTTTGSLWERLFISPCAINYHTEHHLFPGVPFYNLPKIHKELMKIPEYSDNALVYASYFGKYGSLAQLIKKKVVVEKQLA